MLLDIQHDIQTDKVHQLARSFRGFQDILEDSVNFLGRCDAFVDGEEGFAFDSSPDSAGQLGLKRGRTAYLL